MEKTSQTHDSTAPDHNPQHNDSVDRDRKQADQGRASHGHASAPHNPHQGKGHDERGRYARTSPEADLPESYSRNNS